MTRGTEDTVFTLPRWNNYPPRTISSKFLLAQCKSCYVMLKKTQATRRCALVTVSFKCMSHPDRRNDVFLKRNVLDKTKSMTLESPFHSRYAVLSYYLTSQALSTKRILPAGLVAQARTSNNKHVLNCYCAVWLKDATLPIGV